MFCLGTEPRDVYTPYDKEVEDKILELVKKNADGIKIGVVVSTIGQDYDPFTTKEMMWRLISSDRLTLTSDYRLLSNS